MTYRARPYPRITKEMPPHKRKPRPQVRSREHLSFIRQLPCVRCGCVPSQPAHVRTGTDGAAGVTPSDRYTVPLCAICHLQHQHVVGELTFWAELGIDPLDLAFALWEKSGDLAAGERLIFRTQQSILLKRYATRARKPI